jgi:hypothetical protein
MKQLKEIRMREGQGQLANIIQQITNKKIRKNDWKKIRQVMKPQDRSSFNTIEIPLHDEHGQTTEDPDRATMWQRITDPTMIEEKLLDRNLKHFGQAEGSLFINTVYQDISEYEGVSPGVELLLEGKLNVNAMPNLDSASRTLLNYLSNGKQLPKIDSTISYETFIAALKKWPEKTSTSPSGRHLGHYKCLLVDDGNADRYDEQNSDPASSILSVYYRIATLALAHGISLERWQHSTTSMIEKTPGNPRINKLRVIHLYEADYNLLLKKIWAR